MVDEYIKAGKLKREDLFLVTKVRLCHKGIFITETWFLYFVIYSFIDL